MPLRVKALLTTILQSLSTGSQGFHKLPELSVSSRLEGHSGKQQYTSTAVARRCGYYACWNNSWRRRRCHIHHDDWWRRGYNQHRHWCNVLWRYWKWWWSLDSNRCLMGLLSGKKETQAPHPTDTLTKMSLSIFCGQ